MKRIPPWLQLGLFLIVLIGIVAILVYPLTSTDRFIVHNPITGDTFKILRSHDLPHPFHLLWGMEGLRQTSLQFRIGIAILISALWIIPLVYRRRSGHDRAENIVSANSQQLSRSRQIVIATILGLATSLLCFSFRVHYLLNALFGDAPNLPGEVEAGIIFAAEVLTMHIFCGTHTLLGLFLAEPGGTLAIAVVSCACGGVFTAAVHLFALTIGESRVERFAIFAALVGTGYFTLFLGYVETTVVLAAAISLYLMTGVKYISNPEGTRGRNRLICATAAVTIACMTHAAGVLLLPSFALLLFEAGYRVSHNRRMAVRWVFRWARWRILLLVSALPYLLVVVIPHYCRGKFGNIDGGGDNIMFVPWKIDYGNLTSPWVYYTQFSSWHLCDIGSVFIAVAPLSVPLCLFGLLMLFSRPRNLLSFEQQLLRILGCAAGCCLIVPLFWNHDFGMWGDWNLAAAYLIPFQFFSWYIFLFGLRSFRLSGRILASVLFPLVVLQAAFGLGIMLQFYR